jgi:putative glycosyltransferase
LRLSIVSTMYNSARYLEEFYSRICASAAKVASDFEIILVNDGTQDDSLEIALKIQQADESKGCRFVTEFWSPQSHNDRAVIC